MILQLMAYLLEECNADDYEITTALFHFGKKEVIENPLLSKMFPDAKKHGLSIFVSHKGIDCIDIGERINEVKDSYAKSMIESRLYSVYIALAEKILSKAERDSWE